MTQNYMTSDSFYEQQPLVIPPQSSVTVQVNAGAFSVLRNSADAVIVRIAGQSETELFTAIGVPIPIAMGEVTEITFRNPNAEPMALVYAVSDRMIQDNRTVLTADSIFTMRSGNAIATGAVNVGEAATVIVPADSQRTRLTLQNESSVDIYLGGSAVTDADGLRLGAGGSLSLDTGAGIYGIVAAGDGAANEVRYMEEKA